MISANLSNTDRKAVYRRDGYRCALCDSTVGLQIHHVVPRGRGGTNNRMNLICLCWKCHAVAHGTRLPEIPDMDAQEIEQDCVMYLSDLYAEEGTIWNPWEKGG